LNINYNKCTCAIFLQQLFSLIPTDSVPSVLVYTLRSLPKGSYLVFSLLNRSSSRKILAASFLTYALRLFQLQSPRIGHLPYFSLGDKLNLRFFQRSQDTSYWFSDSDVRTLFQNIPPDLYEIVGCSNINLFNDESLFKINSQTGFYYFILQAK